MKDTSATYQIEVTTDEGKLSYLQTMQTRPKTAKGIRAQNTKLENYAKKKYPNWSSIEVKPL